MSDSVRRYNEREVLKFGDLRYSLCFKTDRITSGIGVLPSGGKGDVDEGHEGAEEVFQVVKGELTVIFPVTTERWILTLGDAIIVPPGAPHIVENHGKEETIFTFNVSPGLKGL